MEELPLETTNKCNFTEMPVIDYKHGIWESQRGLKMKRTDVLRPLEKDF